MTVRREMRGFAIGSLLFAERRLEGGVTAFAGQASALPGTEAERLDGKLPDDVIDERLETMAQLAQELCDQRAAERVGERVRVLIEESDGTGRAAHQGPEVDGCTRLVPGSAAVGSLVDAVVVEADGIDLIATEAP